VPFQDPVIALTLYTRPGCHLCDEMKAIVDEVGRTMALELREVDITTDPSLEERYRYDIPVLAAGGRIVAKHRVTAPALARSLESRSRAHDAGG
jgi:hypothetical protein